MPKFDAEPNLLFGLLAVQTGLIDQTALVAAFHACSESKKKSLADILSDQGALDAEGKALIEALVSKNLDAHGGDLGKSLGSVAAAGSTREILTHLGNPTKTISLYPVNSDSTIDASDRRTGPPGTVSVAGGQRFRVLRPHAQGGPGGRVRGTRYRAESRGGAQADPRSPRRRSNQSIPVPARGRDHRRARTPRYRSGLRHGNLRERTSLLRHAVHSR